MGGVTEKDFEEFEKAVWGVVENINKAYAEFILNIDNKVIDIKTRTVLAPHILKLVRVLTSAYEDNTGGRGNVGLFETKLSMHTPVRIIEIMKENDIALGYEGGKFVLINRRRGRDPKLTGEVFFNALP